MLLARALARRAKQSTGQANFRRQGKAKPWLAAGMAFGFAKLPTS